MMIKNKCATWWTTVQITIKNCFSGWHIVAGWCPQLFGLVSSEVIPSWIKTTYVPLREPKEISRGLVKERDSCPACWALLYLTMFMSLFVPCWADGPEISQKQEEGAVTAHGFGVFLFFVLFFCLVSALFSLFLSAIFLNPATSHVPVFVCTVC